MIRSFAFILFLIASFTSCVIESTPSKYANDPEQEKLFSDSLDGKQIGLYTLKNKNGMTVEFTNYGATIVSIQVPDREGNIGNVVLGYDSIQGYYYGTSYFGCVVGRYANRIANGKFTLEGKTYSLPVNNGPNSLHGGINSIDKKVWTARVINDAIRFSTTIKDGENGYPGEVKLSVVYSLTNDNGLVIDYSATTDKTTVLNVTNHAYFNLSADPSKDILDHELQINADAFTPVDSTLIPTGEIAKVKGTPFDFTSFKTIGKEINGADQQLVFGNGYDHNFVLNQRDKKTAAVTVMEKSTGRKMEVFTDQPGVQFYSGNFLDGTEKGRGVAYRFRTGFCLETQHFPDSPNRPEFPNVVLKAGENWESRTVYRFTTF